MSYDYTRCVGCGTKLLDESNTDWCDQCYSNHAPPKGEQDKDTIAASIVRTLGGDGLAKDFKSVFGDWF